MNNELSTLDEYLTNPDWGKPTINEVKDEVDED